jgi:hypothetical protein
MDGPFESRSGIARCSFGNGVVLIYHLSPYSRWMPFCSFVFYVFRIRSIGYIIDIL